MKKILISILTMFTGIFSVNALDNDFKIDTSKIKFESNETLSSFDSSYNISSGQNNTKTKTENNIINLTKKTTYLLLGPPNQKSENPEENYKRYQEYLNLRYAPEVPKDKSTNSGLDENSQEYKDALFTGLVVPTLFKKINELDIKYTSYGNIKILQTKEGILSIIDIPNVKMKTEDNEKPMKYKQINTNLNIVYYFKKLKNKYKLYYLKGKTSEQLSNYITNLENNETKNHMQISSSFDSGFKDIYDYSKLESLTELDFNKIYNLNSNNIVNLNSCYNNSITNNATGFFINDGIIITTWNYIQKSLENAQYISINNDNKIFDIDGLVTANPENDFAIIKLKEKSNTKVNLSMENIKPEDPAITLTSKTGIGLTLQKGIVISNNNYITTTLNLSDSDIGSPLFDKDGNVIGMNISKEKTSNTTSSLNAKTLKEIQDKFNDFDSLKAITFDELKQKYFYNGKNEEMVKNSIPDKKWKEYSKIGNVENNIKLNLVKASYKDKIVSLRYLNEISNYIPSMQLASSFKNKLTKDGYKEVLNSNKKSIYKSKDYQVTIIDNFNYLIVVMVKL